MPENTPSLSFDLLAAGMRRACEEARLWLGTTSPNPPVGAVALDAEGQILVAAAHQKVGTDHAEAALLKICRDQNILPRVHTICCTLEPCNHHGRTPPCSEALIASGIRHIAIGTHDPNPQAAGGIYKLRAAGINVVTGVEEDICKRTMHAFLYHAATGQPFITVKRAFDAKGSMIPPVGQKTFTTPDQLKLAHRLRKKADAIITGSGTILADNPEFTVRHAQDFPAKRRVLAIFDRRGRTPITYIEQAKAHGFDVRIFHSLDSCLSTLVNHEIRDILVESGPILSQMILDSGLWALRVDIGAHIKVTANERVKIPFNTNDLDLESLLPRE